MTSENSEPDSRKSLTDRFASVFRGSRKQKKENTFLLTTEDFKKLDHFKQDMIKGVIGLSDKIVRDIMIPRVDIIAVEVKTTLKSMIKAVLDEGHSRLPVYEDKIDNIVGVVYAKDLLKLLLDKQNKFQLKKFLHEPYFVPETMALAELLVEFKARKQHFAIVVDEYGGVDGMVTLEDILEEIVGDINDEFDSDSLPELEKIKDRTYEVDSRMTLDDFNAELDLELPADDFDTIGGYVFDLFGKIPVKNEEVEENNISYKIKSVQGTVINRIIVTLPDTKSS